MKQENPAIAVGCHVELNLVNREGTKDHLSIDIVSDEMADFSQGFLGSGTTLAKILMGEKAGIVIPYLKDDIYAIEVLSVSPSLVKPADDTMEKRQARLNQALREVEHTNAVVFASSFTGKWGDYDPDSLDQEAKTEKGDSES
jgi:hypothetical protein